MGASLFGSIYQDLLIKTKAMVSQESVRLQSYSIILTKMFDTKQKPQ
jgi:hypothetical protein